MLASASVAGRNGILGSSNGSVASNLSSAYESSGNTGASSPELEMIFHWYCGLVSGSAKDEIGVRLMSALVGAPRNIL